MSAAGGPPRVPHRQVRDEAPTVPVGPIRTRVEGDRTRSFVERPPPSQDEWVRMALPGDGSRAFGRFLDREGREVRVARVVLLPVFPALSTRDGRRIEMEALMRDDTIQWIEFLD